MWVCTSDLNRGSYAEFNPFDLAVVRYAAHTAQMFGDEKLLLNRADRRNVIARPEPMFSRSVSYMARCRKADYYQ